MESEMLESTKNFLRDELTCKICHGLYRMPTLLPCFHSFCHCCVSGRVTKEKRRSLWGLFSNKEKYFIDCIICKCIHNLSKHGVDTLVRNFLLEAITDSYREKIGLKTVLKDCQLCENQDKVLPAVKYCFKCDLSYCAICMQKYHPTRGQYTKHDVAELCRETKLRCPEHHDLTLDFYCIQCHIPSCGACRTLNQHSNHQIVDIVGIYNNVKEIVTSQTVELARRNGQNKTFMNAAITFEKTAKDGGEGLKMHVRKTCQELRKIIDAREKSMIDTIDREVQGRLQKLKMKVSEIHRHWPESDGLQKLTQEVINAKTDPASFLLIADKLRERIADNLKGYNVIGYSYVLTNPLGEWTMFNTASAKKMLESIRIAGRPKPQTSSTANGAHNEVSPRIDRYGEGDVVVEMAGEIPGHMVSLVETGKPLEQNNNNDRVPENFGSRANTDVTQQPRNLERPTTEFSVRQSEKQEGRSLSSESSDAESPPSPTITPSESPPLNFASSPTSARVNFPNFGKVPFNPSQTENNNFGTTTKSATTRNNSFEQNRISPDLKGTENRPCNKLSRDKQPHTVEAGSTLSDATGRGSSIIPANRNNQNCDPVGSYMKFVQRRQQFEVQGQSPLSAANSAVAQNKWSQNQHGRQTGTPSAGTGEHSLTPQAPGEVAHVQSAIVAKAANWDSNQHILKAQTPSADQAEDNIIPCNKPNSESIAQKWRTNDSSGTNGKRSTAIHGATPTLASNNSNAQTKSYPGFTRRVNCTSTDSTSNRKDETTVRTSGGLASNSRSEVGSSLQRRNATTRNGATNSCTQSKLPTPVRDHRIVGNRYNENLQSSSTYNVYGTSRTDSSKIPVLIGTGTYSPVPTKKFQNDNFSPDINDGSLDSLPSATVNGQCNVHSAHTVQTFAASNERVATHNPHNSTNVRQQGINSSKVTRAGDDQVTQKSLNTMLSFRTNTVHPTDQTGVQASAIPAGTVQPNVSMPPSQTFNTSNATKVEVSSSTINNGSNAVSDKRQGTSSTIHHHGSSSGQSDRGPVTASALNVGCTQGRQAARMDMTQTRQGDDFFIDGHSSVLSAKEHTKSGGSATSHTAQIPSDALITEKKNTCPTGIVPLDDNGKIGSGRVSNFALTSADPSRKKTR
ncbi:serine-rich adhesin for platelets-like [Ptychodera flava]|uniref:serine-rich adhesin for platelets-like n=1 Tax=Ptychodera flava TaxID=63121 RepID=UPI00396A4779